MKQRLIVRIRVVREWARISAFFADWTVDGGPLRYCWAFIAARLDWMRAPLSLSKCSRGIGIFRLEFSVGHEDVEQGFEEADDGWDECPAEHEVEKAPAGFVEVKLVDPQPAED